MMNSLQDSNHYLQVRYSDKVTAKWTVESGFLMPLSDAVTICDSGQVVLPVFQDLIFKINIVSQDWTNQWMTLNTLSSMDMQLYIKNS